MIAVTAEDVGKNAPEFLDLSETDDGKIQIDIFIENARIFINEALWGDTKGKLGIIYMACHMMKEMGIPDGDFGSAGGQLISERVGDLQKSYAAIDINAGTALDQMLQTTRYGRMFIMLRKTLLITPLVT